MDENNTCDTSPLGWYFHWDTAGKILSAVRAGKNSVQLSLDLNLSEREWEIRDGRLVLSPGLELPAAALEDVADSGKRVFYFDGTVLSPVEIRRDGYYKLVPTSSAPTLEIDGVKMHRSKTIDPLEDALSKAVLVVRPRDIVLDTCGGLGYSALFAVKAGASRVLSWEKSRAVMEIRARNPWTRPGAFPWLTREAFERIRLVPGDITEGIAGLADGEVHAIIHDPPRFSSATGDLYGRIFYGHLARVLCPGGRLFHYTGSPGRVTGGDRFVNNAARRLEDAGFQNVTFNENLQGLVAEKVPQGKKPLQGRKAGRKLR